MDANGIPQNYNFQGVVKDQERWHLYDRKSHGEPANEKGCNGEVQHFSEIERRSTALLGNWINRSESLPKEQYNVQSGQRRRLLNLYKLYN